MIEDLDLAFKVTGIDLDFAGGTIKGLPNYLPETLYNGDYKVEKQDFRFIVKTKDIVYLSLEVGDEFTFSDTGYVYTFRISNQPLNDLTGVSELICDYIEKVEL